MNFDLLIKLRRDIVLPFLAGNNPDNNASKTLYDLIFLDYVDTGENLRDFITGLNLIETFALLQYCIGIESNKDRDNLKLMLIDKVLDLLPLKDIFSAAVQTVALSANEKVDILVNFINAYFFQHAADIYTHEPDSFSSFKKLAARIIANKTLNPTIYALITRRKNFSDITLQDIVEKTIRALAANATEAADIYVDLAIQIAMQSPPQKSRSFFNFFNNDPLAKDMKEKADRLVKEIVKSPTANCIRDFPDLLGRLGLSKDEIKASVYRCLAKENLSPQNKDKYALQIQIAINHDLRDVLLFSNNTFIGKAGFENICATGKGEALLLGHFSNRNAEYFMNLLEEYQNSANSSHHQNFPYTEQVLHNVALQLARTTEVKDVTWDHKNLTVELFRAFCKHNMPEPARILWEKRKNSEMDAILNRVISDVFREKVTGQQQNPGSKMDMELQAIKPDAQDSCKM